MHGHVEVNLKRSSNVCTCIHMKHACSMSNTNPRHYHFEFGACHSCNLCENFWKPKSKKDVTSRLWRLDFKRLKSQLQTPWFVNNMGHRKKTVQCSEQICSGLTMATESELMLGECSASKFIGALTSSTKIRIGKKTACASVVRLF